MNDSEIRRLIMQAPFELVRQFVAERATCGQCKFWKEKDAGLGDCYSDDFGSDETRGVVVENENYFAVETYTGKDFGCIHWQPRTDEAT